MSKRFARQPRPFVCLFCRWAHLERRSLIFPVACLYSGTGVSNASIPSNTTKRRSSTIACTCQAKHWLNRALQGEPYEAEWQYRFPDIAKNQAEEADEDRSAGSFVLAAAELWDRNHHHPLQARQKCQRPAQRRHLRTIGRLGI